MSRGISQLSKLTHRLLKFSRQVALAEPAEGGSQRCIAVTAEKIRERKFDADEGVNHAGAGFYLRQP